MTDAFVVRPHRRLFDPETMEVLHGEGQTFTDRADIPPAQEDRVVVYDDLDESPIAFGGFTSAGSLDSFSELPAPPTIGGDADTFGWTGFTATVGGGFPTQVIYVSSSTGSDGFNGLYPEFAGGTNGPKETIAAGKALLRNGYPDWLLLKAGDAWNAGFGTWTISGRATAERMVIGSYGNGERPLINQPGTTAFRVTSPNVLSHIAIVGINMSQSFTNNNGAHCIEVTGAMHNFLVEDCYLANGNNLLVHAPARLSPTEDVAFARGSNLVIRRSILVDSYETFSGYGGNGIYISSMDGILIEECVLDRIGMQLPGHTNQGNVYAPGHALYSQAGTAATNWHNTNLLVRGNVVARSDGFVTRSGGTFTNNLYLQTIIGCQNSTNADGPTSWPTGVSMICRGDVHLDGWNLSDSSGNTNDTLARGWAFSLANISSGEIGYCLAANNVSGNYPVGFYVHACDDAANNIAIQDMEIHHNVIYNWGGGTGGAGSDSKAIGLDMHQNVADPITGIEFHHNDFQYNVPMLNIWYSGDGAGGMRAGFDSASNRFHTTLGPSGTGISAGNWNYMGGNTSMAAWMTAQDPDDTTSTHAAAVSYLAPARSAPGWYTATGGAHGIAPDGTLGNYMDSLRLQSRRRWTADIMPTYGQVGVACGTAYNAHPKGKVSTGPLRWIRNGFSDSVNKLESMGVLVTSVLAATGPAAGGTVVTITGAGFQLYNIPMVYFDTTLVDGGTVVVNSDTSITCTTPAHAAGAVTITVDNGDGIDVSDTAIFTYT